MLHAFGHACYTFCGGVHDQGKVRPSGKKLQVQPDVSGGSTIPGGLKTQGRFKPQEEFTADTERAAGSILSSFSVVVLAPLLLEGLYMLWAGVSTNPWHVTVTGFLLALSFQHQLQRWWRSLQSRDLPLESPQIAADPSAVEDAIADLRQRLDDSKPPSRAAMEAKGWRDVSTPVANIAIRFDKNPKPPAAPSVLVDMRAFSRDQHPNFPLVQTDKDGRILGGAMPIFWGLEQWPTWFPFCNSARLVTRFSADRAIWLLRFRVAFVTIDCVVLCMLIDSLKEKGCVDVIMASPPDGSAGRTWLGIQVPAHSAQFRIGYEQLRLSVKPRSSIESEVYFQCKMTCIPSLERLYTRFWQALACWVVPLIAGMLPKFSGSALDRFYNGSDNNSVEARQLFVGVSHHLDAAIESNNAQGIL